MIRLYTKFNKNWRQKSISIYLHKRITILFAEAEKQICFRKVSKTFDIFHGVMQNHLGEASRINIHMENIAKKTFDKYFIKRRWLHAMHRALLTRNRFSNNTIYLEYQYIKVYLINNNLMYFLSLLFKQFFKPNKKKYPPI